MASSSTLRYRAFMSFASQVGAASRHAQRLLAEAADEAGRLLELFRHADTSLAHLGQLLRPQVRADQRTPQHGSPPTCQQVLPLLAQLAVAPLPARPTLTAATPSSSPAACSRGPFQSTNGKQARFNLEPFGAMLRRPRPGAAGPAYRRPACTSVCNRTVLSYSVRFFFLHAADGDAVSDYVFGVSYYAMLAALCLDAPGLPVTSSAVVFPHHASYERCGGRCRPTSPESRGGSRCFWARCSHHCGDERQ
mmetsp:Transcript_122697/g.381994  ORF Transcript_122697/g.381994 Transcript_122697/m.381994 type:complete len:250 (-) Transcript_122697:295-1044(-)